MSERPEGQPTKRSRRERPRTFRLFERSIDGPPRYTSPAACDDCGTTDDDEHATWCRSAGAERAVQAAAHHVGSVHEVGPGEDAPLDEPDADAPWLAPSTRTSRAPSGRRSPGRGDQAGRAAR